MTDDLIERLHALSRYEHSDYSIGDEAATEIEALRAEVERMKDMAMMQAARAAAAEREAERLAEALREAYGQVRELCDAHVHPYPEASFARYEAALHPTAAQDGK